MASRKFQDKLHSLHEKLVQLSARVTFGNTGAPTLDAANSKGIASVSRTSAGLFVFTLQDTYVKFVFASMCPKLAAGSFPAAPLLQVTAETVATAKTITVQLASTAAAATDPANGEEIRFKFLLNDSMAP